MKSVESGRDEDIPDVLKKSRVLRALYNNLKPANPSETPRHIAAEKADEW